MSLGFVFRSSIIIIVIIITTIIISSIISKIIAIIIVTVKDGIAQVCFTVFKFVFGRNFTVVLY